MSGEIRDATASTRLHNAAKNAPGSDWKPSMCDNGEAGSNAPMATTVRAGKVSARLGRLRKNGTRLVRIAEMISVWVARDSTNQPDRNRIEEDQEPDQIQIDLVGRCHRGGGRGRTGSHRDDPVSGRELGLHRVGQRLRDGAAAARDGLGRALDHQGQFGGARVPDENGEFMARS
jgi:hypothetical protein